MFGETATTQGQWHKGKKIMLLVTTLLRLTLCLFILTVGIASAGRITLNFDSVTAAPCVDGTAYLAAAGITISGQASARICQGATPGSGGGAVALSGQNILLLDNPLPTNSTYEYFLNFDSPVSDLSFYRAQIQPDSTGPAWSARALAADGSVIASVGEGTTFGPPVQLFQLPVSGIVRVQFDTNNLSARTYNTPPIDDLTFTTSTIAPEPATPWMLILGLFVVASARPRRRVGGCGRVRRV